MEEDYKILANTDIPEGIRWRTEKLYPDSSKLAVGIQKRDDSSIKVNLYLSKRVSEGFKDKLIIDDVDVCEDKNVHSEAVELILDRKRLVDLVCGVSLGKA